MKSVIALTAAATVALFSIAPAQAFTSWSKFEMMGYDVKARKNNGVLRYVSAVNETTGESFVARVRANGIATVKIDGKLRRIDLNNIDEQDKTRTIMQDLAQLQD